MAGILNPNHHSHLAPVLEFPEEATHLQALLSPPAQPPALTLLQGETVRSWSPGSSVPTFSSEDGVLGGGPQIPGLGHRGTQEERSEGPSMGLTGESHCM